MACLGCSCGTGKDNAKGCRSNGGCATGGCNRHNTYDWITAAGIRDAEPFDIVEITFKNGSRKDFFKNPPFTRTTTGDYVLVESYSGGYDLGQISLSGELVRLQMKRKRVREDARLQTVIRKAHERDMERLDEVRTAEKSVMIRARAITRTLDLNMKICDVEFQGDGRKCTFYYTADGRVDFRELIRHFAKEFKVKIEMRQIGARQESARIGGLGNCGRELCCSTWLTEFKSVNTSAARYQNLAINQTKLSGMCGRLKCCLNYELDTYIDALEDFPDKAEKLRTQAGLAILVKTDVFKRIMYYTYAENRGKLFALHVDQIWEVLGQIKKGELPGSLDDILAMAPPPVVDEDEEEVHDFENVHDVIQLPIEKRKKKKKKKNRDSSQSRAAAIENEPAPSIAGSGRPEQRKGGQKPGQQNAAKGNNNQAQRSGKPEKPGNTNQSQKPQNQGNKPQGERPPQPKQEGNKPQNQRPPQPKNDGNKPGGNQPNQRPPQPKNDGGKPQQNQRPPQPKNDGTQQPRLPRPDNQPKNKGQNRPPKEPPKQE